MAKKFSLPDDGDEGPDLTPMIDIVFLLIVFFMTVASVLTLEKLPVELPVAEQSIIPEGQAQNRQVISINPEGRIYYGISEVSESGLVDMVRRGNETIDDFRIVLRADSTTPHKEVRKVMEAVAEGGSSMVTFAAYQSDK